MAGTAVQAINAGIRMDPKFIEDS